MLPARIVLKVIALVAVMDALLFGAAGRLDWTGPWMLTALYLPFLLALASWSARHAPDLLVERGRRASNVKTWDRVITTTYGVLLVMMLLTAAIDAGRLRASNLTITVRVLGVLGAACSGFVIWSAMAANRFLSRYARIQSDRGQTVVRTGPYRYVRHPMYIALIVLMPSVVLLLGSRWALIPAALIAIAYVVRTALEDRMLREELAGYREYAAEVPYRLVPGVW